MGKKGTKRKTKWRALPLGEEAAGSGNEDDLHDEDRSTASSTVGAPPTSDGLRKQPFCSRMADKPYRQTRRFTYDRFRSKEPLVKLESKTFDEEEYTKITTPRQDVLFKKGYFGRKRESSLEETTPSTGEVDGEEPLMDQIIITNGFVDERGHYLVNGNSYEIYDPYSNTVTVVVGPPPYANGVTHPVLAAVSCQPVPLQPVDWYPPGADWPSQGSAWTPSYPRNPPTDSLNALDGAPNFPTTDPNPSHPYDHPAFLVPAYLYSESPLYNGVPLQTNPPADAHNPEDNRPDLQDTTTKSMDSVAEDRPQPKQPDQQAIAPEASALPAPTPQAKPPSPPIPLPPTPPHNQNSSTSPPTPEPSHSLPAQTPHKVHKQSHSTQTNLLEDAVPALADRPSAKESHSTQTLSEDAFRINGADAQPQQKTNIPPPPPPAKPEGDAKPAWKPHAHRGNEPPRKVYQQRAHTAPFPPEKAGCGAVKVSYAKKAMSGLEGGRGKMANGGGRVVNGGGVKGSRQSAGPVANGVHEGGSGAKQVGGWEERKNGLVKGAGPCSGGRTGKERSWAKCGGERRVGEGGGKCEETRSPSRSRSRTRSEKSSTVSELSSPTELSSGQNTPPEKLIVQKMEQEIKKSFEVKLKQNLTEKEEEEEEGEGGEAEEDRVEEKDADKPKGKKKKKNNKAKADAEKPRETAKGRRKKKRVEGAAKDKGGADTCAEDMGFLSSIRQKDLLFEGWEGFKDSGQDLLSGVGPLLNGDEDILKSLGIEGGAAFSKLPLHSDLLMILPTIGWSRPKLRIEDLFAPPPFDSDLFTKRNITNMKSTRPEEFFASVVDGPVVEKAEKKKEGGRRGARGEERGQGGKKGGKRESKGAGERAEGAVEVEVEGDGEREKGAGGEGRLGIVEAVNTWLQEQGDSEKVLSIEGLGALLGEGGVREEEEEVSVQKNGVSNPLHACCAEADGGAEEGAGCMRVANVINDGFVHLREEFPGGVKWGRMYRSSSWDAKLSDGKMKKHFKFLTDSASFCQDLISDVRNGLPAGSEYATEELCDPKQIVRKYYTLAPKPTVAPRTDSDSENEVFDALEYKFLPKETTDATPNGNASITDSGVHSDVDLSEDAPNDHLKEKTCKLQ